MTLQMNDPFSSSTGLMAFLGILIAIVTTVFWMVVGWRAMRAHERLADTVHEIGRRRP